MVRVDHLLEGDPRNGDILQGELSVGAAAFEGRGRCLLRRRLDLRSSNSSGRRSTAAVAIAATAGGVFFGSRSRRRRPRFRRMGPFGVVRIMLGTTTVGRFSHRGRGGLLTNWTVGGWSSRRCGWFDDLDRLFGRFTSTGRLGQR